MAANETDCPEQTVEALLGVTAVGTGITTLVVVVLLFAVTKLLPETLAWLVIAQVEGELLIVALKVTVMFFPAGILKPEPVPFTVTVSPDCVEAKEF